MNQDERRRLAVGDAVNLVIHLHAVDRRVVTGDGSSARGAVSECEIRGDRQRDCSDDSHAGTFNPGTSYPSQPPGSCGAGASPAWPMSSRCCTTRRRGAGAPLNLRLIIFSLSL